MSYRAKTISKLLSERSSRRDYVKGKLDQIIPSQIRSLRLREEWTQEQLGEESEMKQARVSAMESPGEVNFSLETLIRIAAAFKVGLWVQFVSYSEMVQKENNYSQDHFKPVRLPEDRFFLEPRERIADFDYSQGQQEIGGGGADMASSASEGEIDVNLYPTNGKMQMGAAYGS
jgi:transcriptional regulator with XRE-family HTH domain